MEGERRKRKLERDEEENEEQKMEKFFALIKSTKDARDQLFNKDKKIDEDLKEKGIIWTPMFQPEDFIDSGRLGKINLSASATTLHADAGPSVEERGKGKEVIIEKEFLPEETPSVVAPTPETHDVGEEREKASSDLLDLNLSL